MYLIPYCSKVEIKYAEVFIDKKKSEDFVPVWTGVQ